MKVSPNVLVSIIVPLHNDGKNIVYCLNSLMTQTYKNIEIIVVENGSSDNGYSICRQYSHRDSRIKVFSIEQTGVSRARNFGLDVSEGNYIFFCDSDDFMENDMIEQMVCVLEEDECPIVVCEYARVKHHRQQDYFRKATTVTKLWSGGYLAERMFLDNSIRGSVWNKAFSRKIIGEIRFDNDLSYCEDFHFIMQILSNNKNARIRYLDKKLYNYYINPNSATGDRVKTIDENGNSKYVIAFKKMLSLDFSDEIKDLICASIYRDTISALIFVDPRFLKSNVNCLYEDKRMYKEKYFNSKKISYKDKIRMIIKLLIIKMGRK